MTYGYLRADCLYTGISSGPNTRYRVWEAFTFTFLPPKWRAVTSRPQMGPSCAEQRHTTYRSLRSVHPFLHSSPLYPIPRNRMVCNGPDTPLEVLLPVGASALQFNKWFLGSAGLSVPNGSSIGSAVFAGLTTVTDRQTTLLGR